MPLSLPSPSRTSRWRLAWQKVGLCLAGGLVCAGCAATSGSSGVETGALSDETASVPTSGGSSSTDVGGSAPAAVPEALDFVAEDVDGQEFRAAELAGTPTVLWFWAPWCTVCARSAAEVREVAEANPDVRVIGVAGLASDRGAMQDFVQRNDVTGLTHLADLDGSVYARFGIAQQHSFVLVAADGTTTTEAAYSGQIELADLVGDTFG